MPITINSRKIYDKLRPATFVTNSQFCIGDEITIEIDFTCYKEVRSGVPQTYNFDTLLTQFPNGFTSDDSMTETIEIGDTITITDLSNPTSYWFTNPDYTVLNKVFDWGSQLYEYELSNCITTGNPIPTTGLNSTTMLIQVTNPITYIGMPYVFVDGSVTVPTFQNDNTVVYQQLFCPTCDASNVTQIPMQFTGSKSYQVGSATIEGTFFDRQTGEQRFKIIHTTVVTPIFRDVDYYDLVANIPPVYYDNVNCLKHSYQIESRYSQYASGTSEIELCPAETGNSGWYNEVFNSFPSCCYIDNVVFSSASGTLDLDGNLQTIEFDLNSTNLGFFNSNTDMCFVFHKLPNDVSEYNKTTRNFADSFLYTNTFFKDDGNNYSPITLSTPMQTIRAITCTNITGEKVHIEISVLLEVIPIAIFNESFQPRFMFSVITSDTQYTTASTQDKQCIMLQPYDFNVPVDTTGISATTDKFLRQYEDVTDTGITTGITTFPNDQCCIISTFNGNFTSANVGAVMPTIPIYIKQKIVAKNTTTGDEFDLESVDWWFQNLTYSGGNLILNEVSQRPYNLPSPSIRKDLKVISNNGTSIEVQFPFIMRWEYWIQLITSNTVFYDAAKPNNNINNEWVHFQSLGYKLYHRTQMDYLVKSSFGTSYNDMEIEINDYETNATFTTKDVETYDVLGTALYSAATSKWYIKQNKDTEVRATFTNTTSLDIINCHVVFCIEVFEQGGVGGAWWFSSRWAINRPMTIFYPLTGANTIDLFQPSADTIVAKAMIDHTLLPSGNVDYTIVARLYSNGEAVDYKITEDGDYKITEDSDEKVIE
jgi:hypothetical protein